MANVSEWKKDEIVKAGVKFEIDQDNRWADMISTLSVEYGLKEETVEKLLTNGKA